MTTEPIGALICGPRDNTATAGSVDGNCTECRNEVAISPSGIKTLMDNPGCKVLCMHCGFVAAADEDEPIGASAAARAEIDTDRKSKGLLPLTDAEWKARVQSLNNMVNSYKKQRGK